MDDVILYSKNIQYSLAYLQNTKQDFYDNLDRCLHSTNVNNVNGIHAYIYSVFANMTLDANSSKQILHSAFPCTSMKFSLST